MSKRYGRNQRRKHREEIARLNDRLRMESTRDFYIPNRDTPELEDIVRVISYRVEETGAAYDRVDCTACLTVEPHSSLYDIMLNGDLVKFRGKQYTIANGNYSGSYDHVVKKDHVIVEKLIEIELMAVAK